MNSLFKALSHPVRRRIIAMLRAGPLASGDIAAAFDMSWPTITGHLNCTLPTYAVTQYLPLHCAASA